MIQTTLQQLGFSPKEIDVYLAVLKKNRILPADVAKATNLNRSTVYSIANELKKRGVLNEDLAGPVRYLVALPPEDLVQLAAKDERELQKKKKLINEAVTELRSFVASAVYTPPKISFITQEEINAFLYKRSEIWNKSIIKRDKTWWGFQDHTLVDTYREWIDWFWKSSPLHDNIELKLLSNKSETEKEMKKAGYERRQIKFWKHANEFTSSIWVVGDYLVMIMTRENPHYLVEIHDEHLAQNMREVFKGIWKDMKA